MVLLVGEEKVELLSSKVKVDVVDEDSSCVLTQFFKNPGFGKSDSQEAVYKFPLQSSSAVYLFHTQFLGTDGKVLNSLFGKCFEKEEAREKYEQAKETGKTAQLLEVDYHNSSDIFVMSLGNLKQECQFVRIEVAYHVPLDLEQASTVKRLLLPTRVSPRYGKAGEGFQSVANVVDWKTAFELEINVSLSSNVSMIESPTHKIQTKLNVGGSPMKAQINLAEEDAILSQDFVLKISSDAVTKNTVIVQNPETLSQDFTKLFGDSTIAKLTFLPKFKSSEGESMKNFIFVIDRSGSMSGANMTESRKALLLCLTSLPEKCEFNIVSFGSQHSSLFPKSVAYSKETLKQAREHVEKMQADMGGTEILAPLQEIVKEKSDIQKIVFVLTDGGVSNTQNVIDTVKKAHEESGTRLFSCGIGSGVSTHLVEGIAKVGGGTSTFIAYGERMNGKIAAQMEQAMETPFSDLKIEFSGLKKSESKLAWDPSTVLPKFANAGQLISGYSAIDVKSFIEAKTSGKVHLLGSREGEKDAVIGEVDLSTDLVESDSNLIVPALKQQITKVEEADFEKKSARKKAVDFAICANIVTKYTSLVAVDENDQKQQEASTEKLEIPRDNLMDYGVDTTTSFMSAPKSAGFRFMSPLSIGASKPEKARRSDGRGMMKGMSLFRSSKKDSSAAPIMRKAMPQMMESSFEGASMKKRSIAPKKMELQSIGFIGGFADVSSFSSEEKKAESVSIVPKTDLERLDALVAIQSPDGSFEATAELFKILGVKGLDENSAEMATAVVVQFLEIKLQSVKGEWNLMHKKAMKFLEKSGKDQDALMTKAKEVVNKV